MRTVPAALLLALACSKTAATPPPGPPPTRHYMFRAIAGVSMGAAGASRLVVQHPEKFDAAGFLGGPLDAPLLARNLEAVFLGGFCPADKLEAAAAADRSDGGNRLDRPDGVDGCTQQGPAPLTHYSRSQRFNHWAFTVNGGTFDRGMHLDIFRDLTLAIGNPLAMPITSDQLAAATCAQPATVAHVYDSVYSPHGEHAAITFCDGDAPVEICGDGTVVDWCAAAALNGRQLAQQSDDDAFCAAHGGNPHGVDPKSSDPVSADAAWAHMGEVPGCWAGSRVVPFALAIDINGNGRRDYHEPLLAQEHEPFDDVGADGCDDAHEDGKGGCVADPAQSPFARGVKDPNGDDYDAVTNPAGTEGDFLWEPGEPFQDVGLDGVPGTGDTGEGDGKFTVSAGLQQWYDGDLHLHVPKGVDLYSEGGIRDVFDLGAMAEHVAGSMEQGGAVSSFLDFPSLPPARGTGWPAGFDPTALDPSALTPRFFLAYGNPNALPADIRAGDGDHVGTIAETVNRFLVFFRWLSRRWDPMLPAGSRGVGTTQQLHFQSSALGADQDYAVSLPPNYDDPANATRRYPVLYLLHGYGQSAQDMSGTGLVVNVLSNIGLLHDLIVVYPSGRCCLTGPHGERTCNDAGAQPGWVRECARGSFYLDRPGSAYGQALFELMDVVDASFRTLSPADGPAY
ncbi:MAG TPA: hypothetical protein VLW85_20280 [Myxococcales bacterium]|nr:hypothetical protein [Myxococcales bacterium]